MRVKCFRPSEPPETSGQGGACGLHPHHAAALDHQEALHVHLERVVRMACGCMLARPLVLLDGTLLHEVQRLPQCVCLHALKSFCALYVLHHDDLCEGQTHAQGEHWVVRYVPSRNNYMSALHHAPQLLDRRGQAGYHIRVYLYTGDHRAAAPGCGGSMSVLRASPCFRARVSVLKDRCDGVLEAYGVLATTRCGHQPLQ
mmetsp:Transcript_33522/g.73861  ORF Transcript_33522/g.73861 Transcript_33522/m.73861 type:complete len:200 (-) Transcript_33522:2248-2847(-)